MPRLAEGLELIGEYEGSGFKETPYLARRMDGQVLQLTRLLYIVAEATDGERDFHGIAGRVTEGFGRTVSADNIKFLVEKKLRPLGVLAAADGSSPKLKKAAPMLALNLRTRLVPERAVHAITSLFYPLFHWPVVVAVLGGLVALDAWLFFSHGIAQSARDIAYQPALFLMVFGLVVVSAAFHECGHATACRFGGARPGAMGAGLYLVYPAFFSDVTDAYRLGKWGRVRTDLGGIYFNMIFSLVTAGAYFLTGFEPLLAIIVIQHLEMLHQLLPFLRLDGYYVISDVTGVPDLFSRIRPILRSLIPGREPEPAVTALKPWARVVVTVWVLSVVPILLYILGLMVVLVPRLLATAWDSLLVQYDKAAGALSNGEILAVIAGAIQMVFLVLPIAGLTYTFGMIGKRLGVAAWTYSEGKPALRASFASVALVSFGLLSVAWSPGELYEPIGPDERGTVQESLQAIGDAIQDTVQESLLEPASAEVRDGLETVGEYVPAVRTGSSSGETDSYSSPEEGGQPGSPSGEAEPIRRSDGAAPAGEQPPEAQQGKQDAGEQDAGARPSGSEKSGSEQDAGDQPDSPAGGSGADEPVRRMDQSAPAGEQPSDEPAETPSYSAPAPAPEESPTEAAPVEPAPSYAPRPSPDYSGGDDGGGYSGGDYSGDSGSGRDYSGGDGSGYDSGGSYDSGDSGYDRGGDYSGGDSDRSSGGDYSGGDSDRSSGGDYSGGDSDGSDYSDRSSDDDSDSGDSNGERRDSRR